jgi:hypothetical protein
LLRAIHALRSLKASEPKAIALYPAAAAKITNSRRMGARISLFEGFYV